jgi:hypothetical protein
MTVKIAKTHCCDVLHRNVERICAQHPDRWDCRDMLIEYRSKTDSYGLMIHDGGSSVISIQFCPWCGAKLRDLSDARFQLLEQLGCDAFDNDTIPEEFRTDQWWRERNI